MLVTLFLVTLSFSFDLQKIAKEVNSRKGVTWKAEVPKRFSAFSKEDFHTLNLARSYPHSLRKYKKITVRNDIPEEFDSQKQWSMCSTIDHIYDQGHCGSCWAMATFESLQDRFCIHSNGSQTPLLSAQHMTSCDNGCSGCNGGWTESAFSWAKSNGITTAECIPYQMGTCQHPGCSNWPTPKCNRTCYPNITIPVDKDKYYADSWDSIPKHEESIQTEIMNNGPVTACISVYEDFATYKSGVYQHVTGSFDGLHAIKIVGWGVLDGVKYWKVANSWNTDWGMDGFFLIKRGTNECGIEGEVVSGLPRL